MMMRLVSLAFVVSTCLGFAPSTPSHTRWVSRQTTALEAQKVAVIAGATGYIGKSTVREAVRQGYKTIALVRDAQKVESKEGKASFEQFFDGADLVECDVTDQAALTKTFADITEKYCDSEKIDTVVSCLASRSGIKKDAYLIDYQATLNCLEAGRATGARHFTLLSAFCVKNPWLQFQQAKLKFEAALQEQTDMTWTIVRPTAFFKSVSGQLEVVQNGAPFVMFGDGEITKCNPIAEAELAQYLMDSSTNPSRVNQVFNLGGPDEPMTMKEQGKLLFQAVGKEEEEEKYAFAPVWLFDAIINSIQFFADLTGNEKLENAAETGRIGKYYAVESMACTENQFGTVTLADHYNRIAKEGQEYDPYTTMFSNMRSGKNFRTDMVEEEEESAATATVAK